MNFFDEFRISSAKRVFFWIAVFEEFAEWRIFDEKMSQFEYD